MGALHVFFYLILIWFAFFCIPFTFKRFDNEACNKHYIKFEIATVENETDKVNKIIRRGFKFR